MSRTVQEGLSEAETERLAARLTANARPGALSLEAVDGLFCALIAAPRLVMPSDYLPVILGSGESAAFPEPAAAQDTLGLLMRYWNAIVHDFEHETVHLAYIEEPGVDGIPGRVWARGYMRGTRLAPEGWHRIFGDAGEGLLITIPVVAGEVDPAWPKEPLTPAKTEELLEQMFAGAARAYRYFKQHRQAGAPAAAAQRSQPHERAEAKIGRNDPCPCGSGRKFKKCCGAPESGAVH